MNYTLFITEYHRPGDRIDVVRMMQFDNTDPDCYEDGFHPHVQRELDKLQDQAREEGRDIACTVITHKAPDKSKAQNVGFSGAREMLKSLQ